MSDDIEQYGDTAWAAWRARFDREPTAREAFDAGHSIGWGAGYKIGLRDAQSRRGTEPHVEGSAP